MGTLVQRRLIQTYSAEHEEAACNKQKFVSGFTRTLFQDSACRDFLGRTSGASGVQCWDTFQKAAHRADAFRYAAMFSLGGIYLDIKILVLQDLQNLLVKNCAGKSAAYLQLLIKKNEVFLIINFIPD